MKEKILAVILFLCVSSFVIVNTIVLNKQINKIKCDLYSINPENDDSKEIVENLFNEFTKKERFISLTVSHDDLTNIEDDFVEMIGYLSVKNHNDAKVTKSRLVHSLEHLRRLSSFSIDAII